MMINISITEPQALNPELDDSIEFVEILGLFKDKPRLKYFVIATPDHYVEVMNYVRRLLNEHFHFDKINYICRKANGDIQNVYEVLGEYIETKIDIHLSSGLVIDDYYALSHEINDDTSPVNAAMMLFSDENWIPNKVVDYAA